jgi:hypothetical protein
MTSSSITLKSSFQQGMALWRFNGSSLQEVSSAAPCTWQGDADETHTIDVPEDFRGVLEWRHEKLGSQIQLIGLDAEAPAPQVGWFLSWGQHWVELQKILSLRDWAKAKVTGGLLTEEEVLGKYPGTVVKGGLTAHSVPYRMGDQSAACFLIAKDGVVIDTVKGCGDRTPYITPAGQFSSTEEDREDFNQLLSRHGDAVEQLLRRLHGHPKRRIEAARERLNGDASRILEAVASEIWPITFGVKSPSLAP